MNNIVDGKVFIIGVSNPAPGQGTHALAPYEIVANNVSHDEIFLKVYDPNFPKDDDRKIIFNLNENKWSFEQAPNNVWNGTSDLANGCFMKVVDINLVTTQGTPNWNRVGNKLITADGAGDLFFVDQYGNRLGYENDQFINEIPLAVPEFIWGTNTKKHPIFGYLLPIETVYTTYLGGLEKGSAICRLFGKGFFIEFKDITLDTISNDIIKFHKDESFCSYSTNDSNKNFSVSLDRELGKQSRLFTISNTSVTKGDTIKFQTLNDRSIKYINIGDPKNYSFSFKQVGTDSGSYSYETISMGANETHILTPTDWQNLGTTSVLLEIDQGNDGLIDSTSILLQKTDVKNRLTESSITNFAISQNYPNPFNSQTTIDYQLPQPGHVRLTIYNANGQEIIKLVDEHKGAGSHKVAWNGYDGYRKNVTSGIYFYKIEVMEKENNQFVNTKKMLYLK